MLGKMKVIAMSPELGTSSRRTQAFWLKSGDAIEEVCTVNSRWLEFVFAKLEATEAKRLDKLKTNSKKTFENIKYQSRKQKMIRADRKTSRSSSITSDLKNLMPLLLLVFLVTLCLACLAYHLCISQERRRPPNNSSPHLGTNISTEGREEQITHNLQLQNMASETREKESILGEA